MLLVGVAIFVTIGATVLLAAFARNLFALVALVLLAAISVDAATRELRGDGFGPVSGLLLLLWGLSALAAAVIAGLGWV